VIGDGVATSFTVTHGFGTRNVTVSVYRNTPPYDEVTVDVERTDSNSVTIRTAPIVPGVSAYIAVVAAAGTQASLNVTMDTWHVIGAAGEPAFGSGVSNVGGGEPTAAFRKMPDGRVVMRGYLTTPSSGGTLFVLPVGYRPPTGYQRFAIHVQVAAGGGVGYFYINANGTVTLDAIGSPTRVDLTGVEFDTESVQYSTSMAAMPLDAWHLVGNPAEPQFANSWKNLDNAAAVPGTAVQRNAGFRKYPDGRVRLKGVIYGGSASGSTAFTLPVGCRPPVALAIPAIGWNTQPVSITIGTDGVVQPNNIGASNVLTWCYLDGIEFDTETAGAYTSGVIQNQITIDPWHNIGASGEPAFASGWSNYGGGEQGASFRKGPDGKVYVRGLVNAPAGTSPAFTLPVGYRPPTYVRFAVNAGNGPASMNVSPAGVVTRANPAGWNVAADWLALDDIIFDTDTVFQTASVAAIPLDNWHYVGAPGEPAMVNSWVNFDNSLQVPTAGQRNARFRKFPDGRVRLAGFIKSGTNNTSVFTLPAGYRPPVAEMPSGICSGGMAQVNIGTDGTVTPNQITGATTTYTCLDGIEFDTELNTSYATGAIANQIPMDVWHTVGNTGEPAFVNNWVNYDTATYNGAGFRKQPDGRVTLKGFVKAGTAAVMFTLPAGYRPPKDIIWTGTAHNGSTYVPVDGRVYSNGGVAIVNPPASATVWVSLESISFDTESVFFTASQAAQPMDTWHIVGAAGEPAFNAFWQVYSTEMVVGFRKGPDGKVQLKGLAQVLSGGAGTVFTLPVGYRPSKAWRFCVAGITGPTYFSVNTDGTVQQQNISGYQTLNANAWYDLSVIEFDTETVTSYSSGFIQVNAPTRVTSLPVAPYDGQEVYYVADAANGILWHLRYNAASASAYKWECVGAPAALCAANESSVTLAVGVADTANAIVLPLAGDYEVSWGACQTHTTGQFALGVGQSASLFDCFVDTITYTPMARTMRINGLVTATALKLWALQQGATLYRRTVNARPVRVG
jgi:hypothetical protein